jgi:L-alanine-DL-glutamate epimerase-like enolase superfamily enzyme
VSLSTPPVIERAQVACYRVPTDAPESDGTLAWDSTTLVLVTIEGGGIGGLGYTYADTATGRLIKEHLLPLINGGDATAIAQHGVAMRAALRNLGALGCGAMAISAVDNALWDLKAKLYGASLVDLLGGARAGIPAYGSGGFTSYSRKQLGAQLAAWADMGLARVKMKVGREPVADAMRVESARAAIGPDVELFVDANGAYARKQALAKARQFADFGVTWFEEPVVAADLEGLHLLREHAPPDMAISAGEYGYEPLYFRRMLEAQAVDVLQADVTRCGGISGFLAAGALCAAHQLPLSSHCAPALHLHVDCAVPAVCHLEYFHDHVRIEELLFAGAPVPIAGCLYPDRERCGFGLEFKEADARAYAV